MSMNKKAALPPSLLAMMAALAWTGAALAQAPAPAAVEAKTEPTSWWSTVTFSGVVESGITVNPDSRSGRVNFGHLFTDQANTPVLNQLLLTAERPLDPKATGFDFGFKLQGMYGSDARYTHFLRELDRVTDDKHQLDIVEAYGAVHTPFLTEGGIDFKVGQYVTLEGAEVIDPRGNLLYSHSYIFNFGIPLKHTGVLSNTHLTPNVDLYLGIDSGVNTSLGSGDNNHGAAFHGGLGFNFFDGALSILATTHIGHENPNNLPGGNRYLNDITATWKVTDDFTLITDLNYVKDDGYKADGYGVAQYAAYKLNDWFKLVGRAEVWRDDEGFFVAGFPSNFGFVNVERGLPARVITTGPTTYGSLTFGVNITPPVPGFFEGLTIRPEVRYDHTLNSSRPFDISTDDVGHRRDQFTFGIDFVIPFSNR